MKKSNIKKALTMVAGSLVVALIVSILPGGFFVDATKGIKPINKNTIEEKVEFISIDEAKENALKRVNDKTAKVVRVKNDFDDKVPHYDIKITTVNYKYELEVDAVSGIVDLVLLKRIELKEKDVNDDDDVENVKPTEKAQLNQEIKEMKKQAIEGFKEETKYVKDAKKEAINNFKSDMKNPDINKKDAIADSKKTKEDLKEDKKDAIKEFKAEMKDAKEFKKAEKDLIKEDKKEKKDNNGKGDQTKSPIKTRYISEDDAFKIALEKIGSTTILEDIETEYDENPPAYLMELRHGDYKYEIKIHAITGKVLEYEREEY